MAMKSAHRNDFVLQVAQNRVVLEQVGQRRGAGQVVDGNKIDLPIASEARKTLRPMRPKPLIPTLTAMCVFSFVVSETVVELVQACSGSAAENRPSGNSHQTHDRII